MLIKIVSVMMVAVAALWMLLQGAQVVTLESPDSHTTRRLNVEPAYEQNMTTLIKDECAMGIGGNLDLSAEEKEADKIIQEAKQVLLKERQFPSYKSFFHAKEKISETKLFKLLQRFPKGALLHLHYQAMVESDFLVNKADDVHCHICRPVDKEEVPRFRFFDSKEGSPLPPACTMGTQKWIPCKNIPKEYIRESLSLVPWNKEPYPDMATVWKKFLSLSQPVKGILLYKPVFDAAIEWGLKKLIEDNVQHVELRGKWDVKIYNLDQKELIEGYAIECFQRLSTELGISINLIYTTNRGKEASVGSAESGLKKAKDLSELYPEMVVGYDIVGQEDFSTTLEMYSENLQKVDDTVQLPYFFHAGETKRKSSDTDHNLYVALLLKAKRIAHGYSLVWHPLLIEAVKEKGIAIEVCPISNQVLGLVHDLRNHPMVFFFANNLPVVIGSDDPGMWGIDGVSYDWFVAFLAAGDHCIGIGMLKQLALNSIKYSNLNDAKKKDLKNKWDLRWETYLKELIKAA